MIFLALPYNYCTGWGVCSLNLATELSQLTRVRFCSEDSDRNGSVNSVADAFFRSVSYSDLDFLRHQRDYPLVQALEHDLTPYMGYLGGSVKVGLAFSDRRIPSELVERSRHFDFIVAGSSWCQKLLEENGVKSVVIRQGVNGRVFNRARSRKLYFRDDFLIFSGGKYEPRKGQDVVIRAFRVVADKFPDARLVCNWSNSYTGDDGRADLAAAGVPMERVIFTPMHSHDLMADVYQNTDVGVFPSRCEAGTNLVLMEYMACGKPAIATVGTGQGDVLDSSNGLPLQSKPTNLVSPEGDALSVWEEPDLDHLVSLIEWAHENRGKLGRLGSKAARDMGGMTWARMASEVMGLLQPSGR